jgi:hypothetical protein
LRISLLNLMHEDNSIDETSRIEARLEEHTEVSERCRKIRLVSKVAIAGGVSFGARYGARPIRIQSGRRHRIDCHGLGGIVSFGSNEMQILILAVRHNRGDRAPVHKNSHSNKYGEFEHEIEASEAQLLPPTPLR